MQSINGKLGRLLTLFRFVALSLCRVVDWAANQVESGGNTLGVLGAGDDAAANEKQREAANSSVKVGSRWRWPVVLLCFYW